VADSEKKKADENLFQIMDGIISQLNKTKKMFIIMILTLLILPPISFVITFAVLGPPMFFGGVGMHPDGFGHGFGLARAVPILIFLIWLGIGIRQWFVLSKWTKKYERYKELQKKIDEKLDYDTNGGNEEQ
jgi:Na+-driven multidrug efflux pump